ncbi:hypothetical protein H2Y56_22010 [Pectobacterium aroidearum]|uniref:Uncharacterized protein n=1 Tax=Pectobacterium aroidearum TaxID=1201031 RepID=A0ABR5ZJM0_9GAMM|nr:hypothetical protein [Pectobacterium aroidearum]MBA5234759.1 hypothetical protein [Pectobacterium aroidearum]MBA5739938.1 hypothetical protein [Pectobacterium aroidearum]
MATKKDKPADEKTSAEQQAASIPDGTGAQGGTPTPENGKPSGDGAEDGSGGESADADSKSNGTTVPTGGDDSNSTESTANAEGGEMVNATVNVLPADSQSNGTTVPDGGDTTNSSVTSPPDNSGDNKMASDLLPDGRLVIQFLGPHHRYSRGDKAAFNVDYAEPLIVRGIACLPRDYAKHQKGRVKDDYDLGI